MDGYFNNGLNKLQINIRMWSFQKNPLNFNLNTLLWCLKARRGDCFIVEDYIYTSTVFPIFPFPHLSLSLAGDDLIGSLTAWTVDEEVRQKKEEQGTGCLPERDKYLDMNEEDEVGEEVGNLSDRKRKKNEHFRTLRKFGTSSLAQSYISKEEAEKTSSTPSRGVHLIATEPAGVSSHHCPMSQPALPVTAPILPHRLHFTAEEIASAPGIEAETLPEMSCVESLPESHRSHISLKSSPRCPELKLRASFQQPATFSEEVTSNPYSGVSTGLLKGSVKSHKRHEEPTPSPRKTRQRVPEATCSSRSLSTVGTDSLKCNHQTTSPHREPGTPRARRNAAEADETR